MLRSMSGHQFVDWMAYSEIEPFGEERADLRLASITRMLFSIHRDTDKSPEVPGLGDFYASFLAEVQEFLRPPGEKPPGIAKRQTPEQQKAILLEYAVAAAVRHQAEQERLQRANRRAS